MNDRFFADSNVIIYSLGKDRIKKGIAVDLINQYPTISTQVINEVAHIAIKKLKLSKKEAFEIGRTLISNCETLSVNEIIVLRGFEISERYQFSIWDSMIVAAAIEGHCDILYTEDLQDGQMIENKLTVKNPFKNK